MADEVDTATKTENLALSAPPAPSSLATRTLHDELRRKKYVYMKGQSTFLWRKKYPTPASKPKVIIITHPLTFMLKERPEYENEDQP